MAKGRLIFYFFIFASCQFALTTSTSAPELTVVGGLPAPPGYSCIGEEVTLRCTWNPDEVLLGGWDVNDTLHALEELTALEGHTATTANGQANLFITSSRNSITTYGCAVNLHNDNSVTLRSNPTTVKYDDSSVSLDITHTRSTDSLSVTVRVQHRGCTDPIDTVMVSINSSVGENHTRKLDINNRQDLQPCVFGGLFQNLYYKITIMTGIKGIFSEYQAAQPLISMPRNEGNVLLDHNESIDGTLIGVCVGVAVLLVLCLVVACAAVCLYLYLRSRKDCCPLKSYDKPSRDSLPASNHMPQSEPSLQRTSESSDTSEAYSSDPLMHQISNEPTDQVDNKDVYEQPNIPPSVPARLAPPTAQPLVPPRAPIDPNAIQYAELDHSGPRPIKPPPLENVRYVRIQQHRKNFAPHVQPPTAPATAVQGAANV